MVHGKSGSCQPCILIKKSTPLRFVASTARSISADAKPRDNGTYTRYSLREKKGEKREPSRTGSLTPRNIVTVMSARLTTRSSLPHASLMPPSSDIVLPSEIIIRLVRDISTGAGNYCPRAMMAQSNLRYGEYSECSS